MTIKTIIIDDERLARKELTKLLQAYPEIEIIDEASNVDEAFEKIENNPPDLIFLDIKMPQKSGFDLLEILDVIPIVVFTTAYDHYAIKAFEVNAIDYLLKPIDQQRLQESIIRAKVEINKKTVVLENNAQKYLNENDQVFVKDGEKCWFVKLANIRMFESAGNYSKVFFETHNPLILKSLNALEEKLDPKLFFRANRKFIINLKLIKKIQSNLNGGLLIEMMDNNKIDISRRQSVKFKEMMSL